MAQQNINYGSAPNDGTGDTLRDAMVKCEDNFTELYGMVGGGSSGIFTATLSNIANVASSSVNRSATYTKIGRTVHVKLDIVFTPTAVPADTQINVTNLPFAVDSFEGATQYIGTCITSQTPHNSGFVQASGTTAQIYFNCTNISAARLIVMLTYITTV